MSNGEQWRRPAAEAIGTFMLVVIGPGAAAVDRFLGHGTIGTVGVALAFFFAILLAIVSLAGISGAHINPAVTIALWSVGRHDRRSVISYVGAQCAGAMLAGLAIRLVVGDAAAAAVTTPAIPVGAAFGVELVFSAILMWVIMRVTSDDWVPPHACTARHCRHGRRTRAGRRAHRLVDEPGAVVRSSGRERCVDGPLVVLDCADRRYGGVGSRARAPHVTA